DGKRMVVLWGRDNGTFVFRTLPSDGRIALSSLPEADMGDDITAMRGLFEYRKLPASGVPLELRDANGNVVQTTITDGLGRFDFPGLTPGKDYTVALAITDSSLAQQGQLFILNQAGNKVAVVRKMQGGTFNYRTLSRDQVAGLPSLEEDDAMMDVQLTRISGIFEYDKLPAAGVALYLVDENDQIIQVVTTDAQGRFDFSRLPADQNYLIRIGGEDGTMLDDAKLFITDGGGKKVAIVQKFAAGEFKFKPLSRDASGSLATMEEEEVALEAGLSAITGVFTYDKLPASGVTLFLVDENDQIIQEVVTDARGRFDFSRLPADKNYLIKVKGEDGDLLDEGVIYLTDSRGEKVDEVKEVADGEFQYRTLARQGAAPLESLAEEEAFPDESLTRFRGIFEHGNLPASGVTLYLVDDKNRIIQVVTTDARGRFDFKKLPSDHDYMVVMATEDGVLLEDGALYLVDETGNKQAMPSEGRNVGKGFRYRVLSREEIGTLAAVSEADAAMELVRSQLRKTNPNRVKVDAARQIKFGFNIYLLTRNDKAILEEHIVPELRQSPALGVEIHGHTDAVGSAYNNQKMSEYRA
ncbi:MAG: hypothetical protein AAGB22_09550, partial [Bacteroidota bacterium]